MSGGHSVIKKALIGTIYNKKKPQSKKIEALIKEGGDILSHITAVPSAQLGLTSLFGKVRGEPQRNNHLNGLLHLTI